jgi:hypothetical protein
LLLEGVDLVARMELLANPGPGGASETDHDAHIEPLDDLCVDPPAQRQELRLLASEIDLACRSHKHDVARRDRSRIEAQSVQQMDDAGLQPVRSRCPLPPAIVGIGRPRCALPERVDVTRDGLVALLVGISTRVEPEEIDPCRSLERGATRVEHRAGSTMERRIDHPEQFVEQRWG